MDIAVLGTGIVGRTLAARLAGLGHAVTLGTRSLAGAPAHLKAWQSEHPVVLATFGDAAAGAELIINATNGLHSLEALRAAGADALAGKVIMDVANALDFSAGFPPRLAVDDTDSVAEQLQREFPAARVVKALNTVNSEVMVDPGLLPSGGTLFVCVDDRVAKEVVTGLVHDLGHGDVIDLGGIEQARGLEQYLALWVRVMSALGHARFNIKVVRG